MEYWMQPLAWLAAGILALVGIYAALRLGSRAYFKSRAEYDQSRNKEEQ